MERDVGVLRDGPGLARALDRINALCDAHGQADALVAARLIVTAARARAESRGAHFRSDFPHAAAAPQRSFLTHAAAPA